MMYDAFEIEENKIIYYSNRGQTMVFEYNEKTRKNL